MSHSEITDTMIANTVMKVDKQENPHLQNRITCEIKQETDKRKKDWMNHPSNWQYFKSQHQRVELPSMIFFCWLHLYDDLGT